MFYNFIRFLLDFAFVTLFTHESLCLSRRVWGKRMNVIAKIVICNDDTSLLIKSPYCQNQSTKTFYLVWFHLNGKYISHRVKVLNMMYTSHNLISLARLIWCDIFYTVCLGFFTLKYKNYDEYEIGITIIS